MAGRGPDERWGRLARLDRGEVKARPSGFPEERPERRNATSGAPGGARAARHAAPLKGAIVTKRRTALRSLILREEGNEGGAPRLTTQGADESRLQGGLCRHYCPEIARRVSSVTSFGVA